MSPIDHRQKTRNPHAGVHQMTLAHEPGAQALINPGLAQLMNTLSKPAFTCKA